MTAVLGIDLASARWTFNGSALLHFHAESGAFTHVVPGAITWPDAEAPLTPLTPGALAAAIHACASREHVRAVALDGPHGWRNPLTPADAPGVGRRCEYLCRTQGKTGVYPKTYPGNQFAWIDFCVQVFDALLAQPGVRLADVPAVGRPPTGDATGGPHAGGVGDVVPAGDAGDVSDVGDAGDAGDVGDVDDGYVVLECFPTSIWRASGLTPLPAKAKRPDVQAHYDALAATYALPSAQVTSHDDLQAIVAALAAVGAVGAVDGAVQALPRGEAAWMAEHADGPRRVEGFIWDAAPCVRVRHAQHHGWRAGERHLREGAAPPRALLLRGGHGVAGHERIAVVLEEDQVRPDRGFEHQVVDEGRMRLGALQERHDAP